MSDRVKLLEQVSWGFAHAAGIRYAEVRPMPLRAYADRDLPLVTDCSGWITCCFFAAGAPDPTGNAYNGEGNTDSMMSHLPTIPKADALPGDIALFGPSGATTHAVILLQSGKFTDPRVGSNGQEAGPWVETLDGEIDAHPGELVTYKRALPAEPPPPRHRWEVYSKDGTFHDHTPHPALWAVAHPKRFRRSWNLSFHKLY